MFTAVFLGRIALLCRSFACALTLRLILSAQHKFVSNVSNYRALVLDAASHAMNKVEFTQAIEFLEQGRSLLSSQMRGLRTPLNRLSDVNKTLAERFESCNRRLETLIMSYEAQASGSGMGGSVDRASYQGQNLVDEMLVQMRRSTEDQEAIINDLRRLPRFENFLRASFFEVMHQAASEGPIIVLNHS